MTECKCFAQLDALLKPHGGELLRNLFGPPRAVISTNKLDVPKGKRRKSVPIVFASFCPFCGVKYTKEKDSTS